MEDAKRTTGDSILEQDLSGAPGTADAGAAEPGAEKEQMNATQDSQ